MAPDRSEAFAQLEELYRELAAELRWINPLCRASGECCRFAAAGHELWTTPLEYDYLMAHESLDGRAFAEGVCPFLTPDRKCGARDHRMLGCRIYFCDPAYFRNHMTRLYEAYFARVKAIMREHGIPYAYFRFMDRAREHFAKREPVQ
jgi:Fe-S-cluster containining protein